MTERQKKRTPWTRPAALPAIACALLGVFACHLWSGRDTGGPHAILTVTSVVPETMYEDRVDINFRVECHGISGWSVYRSEDKEGWRTKGVRFGGNAQYSDKILTGEVREGHAQIRSPARPAQSWEKNYTTVEAVGTRGVKRTSGLPSRDWRGAAALVEPGVPYTVNVDHPLLLGRTIRHGDGTVIYWWLRILTKPQDDPMPTPSRYWPVHAVLDGEDTIKIKIAWVGARPTRQALKAKLAPRYRVVENSRMREIPAKVALECKGSGTPWIAAVTISLLDIPADHKDVLFACDLAGGLPSHSPVELAVRRRRFHGEVYPLGVVNVMRSERISEDVYDMQSYRVFPQLNAAVGYGRSIYLINPTTLERELLWDGEGGGPKRRRQPGVGSCDVTTDGKQLAFYGFGSDLPLGIHVLDIQTRKIVVSAQTFGYSPRSSLRINEAGDRLWAATYGGYNSGTMIKVYTVSIPGGEIQQSGPLEHYHRPGTGRRSEVTGCVFSPDAGTVVADFACGCVLAFDTLFGSVRWEAQVEIPKQAIHAPRIAIQEDGQEVWVGSRNGIVRRSMATGAELGTIQLDGCPTDREPLYVMRWSRYGERLAVVMALPSFWPPGIVVFGDTGTTSAKQCIPRCFPESDLINRGRLSPVGFVDERRLLARYWGLPGGKMAPKVCELLLIDLDRVPSLASGGAPAGNGE
ncbi:MAG: hypothetical protein HN380_11515 [Victivallales bacterium]|jgi:hypothetical protein|nr:hypothetical protein [Victivallales bacterium]